VYQDKQLVYKADIVNGETFRVKITKPPKPDHNNKTRFHLRGGSASFAQLFTNEDNSYGQQTFDFYIKGDWEAEAFIRGVCEYGASIGLCEMKEKVRR
jgi:hypothetical protein